ncbi:MULTISPECIES: MFS transporter [unclassified Bacillus (in: firmicutes)]|uniref:MDR family MFS transporter n=1 Tax=unclassified Bacillus (in: firmicutes) TaxID=185979 RepID=UPI0008EEA8EC|nr:MULTISPECIES: MFS transporter [unclassified Bacillus (in: firmicutes)]SFA88649.1 Na+/melibiose symporter [Bacillus sp. UNCCL13]SFQ84662.1 Na+/melibiose symporter [Bacillus sp. cl95]
MKNMKQIHPLIWNVLIGTLFGRMATSMSIPFLAIYLTNVKGVSPSQTGLIIAISSLVGIGTSFFGGYLSDRFGRKIILYISIFMWTAVFIGFGTVQTVAGFFVVNAMNGFCKSIFEPTSRALLADLTKKENRLSIFNLRYTAINIGVIFGPILGYYLGSSKTTFPFFIAAAVYAIYGISLILTFKNSTYVSNNVQDPKKRVTVKEAFLITKNDRILLWSIIGLILVVAGYAQFSSTLPQFLSNTSKIEDGAKLFSILMALNAIVVITLQYPLLKIGKKYSPLISIVIGNIVTVVSLLGMGISDTAPMWMIMMVIFTIGEVLMFTMTDMFMDTIAKPGMRGTYFGAMGFMQFGNVLGPAIGGLLLDSFGYEKPMLVFGLLALLSVCGAPILLYVQWRMNKTVTLDHTNAAVSK